MKITGIQIAAISIGDEGGTPTITPLTDEDIAKLLADSGEHIAQYFSYAHLPPHLAAVSKMFAVIAAAMLELPRNPERSAGLRKVIEAKDCAVRAAIAK